MPGLKPLTEKINIDLLSPTPSPTSQYNYLPYMPELQIRLRIMLMGEIVRTRQEYVLEVLDSKQDPRSSFLPKMHNKTRHPALHKSSYVQCLNSILVYMHWSKTPLCPTCCISHETPWGDLRSGQQRSEVH